MFDFNDWGSYIGNGYLNKEAESELIHALNSEKDFDTDWHGFKHEFKSMKIVRKCGCITVYMSACMDSALESTALFSDFLTEEEYENLTDDMIERIRNFLYSIDYFEEVVVYDVAHEFANYNEVMEIADRLKNVCTSVLYDNFFMCIAATLKELYKNPSKEFIKARIEKYTDLN